MQTMIRARLTKTIPCKVCRTWFLISIPTLVFTVCTISLSNSYCAGWSPQPGPRKSILNAALVATSEAKEILTATSARGETMAGPVRRSWNEYRIGDGVALYPGAPACAEFPGSIVCAYHLETNQPNNISALVKVLDQRAKTRIDDDIAVVHVRLGDGLCAKVDEPCRGTKTGDPDCWNHDEDCWYDNTISRQYTYSKYWYESVISQLQKLEVKKIIIEQVIALEHKGTLWENFYQNCRNLLILLDWGF